MTARTLLLGLSFLTSINSSPAREVLVIAGSDVPGARFVPKLLEAYQEANPGTKIEMTAEGSTAGIAAVINGSAHLGMASRPATPAEMETARERGVTLRESLVAQDALGVLVNAANPVTNLTRNQVEQLFTGELANWSAAGGRRAPVSVYVRNSSSALHQAFRELALGRRPYTTASRMMTGFHQLANDPTAISYASRSSALPAGIRFVAIDGAYPDEKNVRAGTYPYLRPVLYYTNGSPSGESGKFLDFTLSAAGRKLAKDVGLVPLKRE